MKPSQYEIILGYLQKGVEIFTTFQHTDNCNQDIEIVGCINCIQKEGKYFCLIREIRSDNQKDHFEEDFYDKNEEMKFDKIEDLIEYLKSETNLSLDNFRKAKNDIYYK